MDLDNIKNIVREELSKFFQGLPYYNEFVRSKMLHIIDSITSFKDLCQENVGMMLERCFTTNATAVLSTEIMSEIKHGLLAVYVLIQYYKDKDDPFSDFLHNTKALISHYPVFNGLESGDLLLLLRFRNAMVCALKFVSAEQHKKNLLAICAMLEGRVAPIKYHTGSGMSLHTIRRVLIYLTEAKLELDIQRNLVKQLQDTRRCKNRKVKSLDIPCLTNEEIAELFAFPVADESRLIHRMKESTPVSLSMDESIALMTLTNLFRDVRQLEVLVGGAVLKELSTLIQALKSNNALNQDIHAASKIDEDGILTRNFRGFELNDKDMLPLWSRLKAAVSVLKMLLLQDMPATQSLFYPSKDDFLVSYDSLLTYSDLEGHHQSLLAQEQEYLFLFASSIRLLHAISPHILEQTRLLHIGERMEGSHNHYTTGGGSSEATKRRLLIARREVCKSFSPMSLSTKKGQKRKLMSDVPSEIGRVNSVKRNKNKRNTSVSTSTKSGKFKAHKVIRSPKTSRSNKKIASASLSPLSSSYTTTDDDGDSHQLFQFNDFDKNEMDLFAGFGLGYKMTVDDSGEENGEDNSSGASEGAVMEDGVHYESDDNVNFFDFNTQYLQLSIEPL